jgi:hypothetical protein
MSSSARMLRRGCGPPRAAAPTELNERRFFLVGAALHGHPYGSFVADGCLTPPWAARNVASDTDVAPGARAANSRPYKVARKVCGDGTVLLNFVGADSIRPKRGALYSVIKTNKSSETRNLISLGKRVSP